MCRIYTYLRSLGWISLSSLLTKGITRSCTDSDLHCSLDSFLASVKENTYDDAYVTDDAAVDDEYYYEGKGGKGYGGKGYAGKGCSGKGCGGKSGGKSGGKGGGKSGGKAVHGGKGHGGGGGKGKGKGHVKEHPGKGGKGTYDDDFYPSIDDFYLDDQYYDDEFINGDQCQLVTFNETFSIPGATLFLAPDTSVADPGNPDLPGTVFIFEVVDVLEINGVTPIQGTTLSGTCTRTDVDPDGGGGICQFVFLDEEGYSITVEGFLPGPLGGPLAVTGGTGDMVGVNGEMDFFPIFDADEEGDIFIDAIRYEVIADLGIIVCP